MIEAFMFAGIGFLAASLPALVIIPRVHARAERLLMRQIEASVPLSIAEIQADKDHLRAEGRLAANLERGAKSQRQR